MTKKERESLDTICAWFERLPKGRVSEHTVARWIRRQLAIDARRRKVRGPYRGRG